MGDSGLGVTILAVSWAETGIGLAFFILRAISNWMFVRRLRWDFALAILTVTVETVAQACLQVSVHFGMGRHINDLDDNETVQAIKWGWAFQLLAIAASMLGKLAITAFLIQIRGRHEKKPWFLIVLGAMIAAVNITVFGTILGQCKPVAKLWNDSIPGTCDPGRLVNQNYSFFQASFNSFSDALLALYPIHLFWKLQMQLRLKLALCTLMGLGWTAAACSAVKTYELQTLTETTDITYALSRLLIWASTEAWIVIIVGCIPPIRPVVDRIFQRLGLTHRSTSRTPQSAQRGYAGLGTSRSALTSNNNSQYQYESRAYSSRIAAGRKDDLAWVELVNVAAKDGSKEEIIPRGEGVTVTTNIQTTYEGSREGREPMDRAESLADSGELAIQHGDERPDPRKLF